MQIDDCKNLLTQSKDHIDTTTQTDVFERNDKSCQTDTSNRNDFQVQAFRGQKEPVSTQTDISPKCDFQVQVNISPANDSKAVQTIKEEIDMPNIPSSTAQTPAKKRKLSSSIRQQSEPITTQTDSSPKCDFQVQANIPPINVSKAVQTIKEEIAMPNIPSSIAQTAAKKRKLSSNIRHQGEEIAIQTGISPKCDFQVQANIPLADVSKAVQTMPKLKLEIAKLDDSYLLSLIPTKNGQKPAGTPLSNQVVKQRQAMPVQKNTRPAQAKDVKERFIFIHHEMAILAEMAFFIDRNLTGRS